jgi:putative tryptophan/tyrosine transport system substrate-binding protein
LLGGQDATIMKPRLNELGHTEGRNLTFDCRYAEGEPEFLPQLAAEIVKNNPDVVVAGFGTFTAKAAQRDRDQALVAKKCTEFRRGCQRRRT